MTRDQLIAKLLMAGFVQDRPTDTFPNRAHVYYTDELVVSIAPDKEWGIWDVRAFTYDRAHAHALAHAHDRALARGKAHKMFSPSEYNKLWEVICQEIN